MFRRLIAACFLTALCALHSAGADLKKELLRASPEAIKQWRDLRFGMFIHWGPASLSGEELSWARGTTVPIEEYDQLYKRFNPEQFNADEWIRLAKQAGMKYIVFVAKHHDGFCMWPSRYVDYDISNTPFKRDITKELKEACDKYGIEFGVYYSVADWRHPDFPTNNPRIKPNLVNPDPNMPRYAEYLKNQVRELLENYGETLTLWFDGPQGFSYKYGEEVIAMARNLQPDILINNRVYDNRTKAGLTGDYSTSEQYIGNFNRERPWESCMTFGGQWSWKPNEDISSSKEVLQMLLYAIGGDGNILLNVGPMPDGRFDPRHVAALEKIGQWTGKYPDAIYGTRGGPFMPGRWGASVCKDSKIYLFVMNWPDGKPLFLKSGPINIKSQRVLTGGKAVIDQVDGGFTVDVPAGNRDDIATVVELTVEGNAFDIEPVRQSESVSFGRKARSSGFFNSMRTYAHDKAFDENPETRWLADGGKGNQGAAMNLDPDAPWSSEGQEKRAYLEVYLAGNTTVNRAVIDEGDWNRIRKFELQVLVEGSWKTIHSGTTIGHNREITFDPVTGKRFRVYILEATEIPTVCEFQLFDS